jgi:hypothetical protein
MITEFNTLTTVQYGENVAANKMSYKYVYYVEQLKDFTKLDGMVRTFQSTLIQHNLMAAGCTGNWKPH